MIDGHSNRTETENEVEAGIVQGNMGIYFFPTINGPRFTDLTKLL